LRRRGYDNDKINEIQNIYRILFQNKYNTSQALEIIETDFKATQERDEILTFIRNSQSGIMKGFRLE
jgi:UDP-N-acetylglucosamine acyltransferase